MIGDSTAPTRAHLAHVARHLAKAVYSTDMQEAGQAAYYLVVNSEGYGDGLNPQGRFDHLTKKEAKIFLAALKALLRKKGHNFIARLSATVGSKTLSGEINVEIAVEISCALAFEVNGAKIILGDGKPPHFSEDAFEVGCPIATERTSLKVSDGDGRETLMSARANFVIPEKQMSGTVPCVIASPLMTASRQVPLRHD